jgi:hypothetical protein
MDLWETLLILTLSLASVLPLAVTGCYVAWLADRRNRSELP